MSDQLTKVFADVLKVDASELTEESSPDTLEAWDSLVAMMLVSAIEDTFDVRLSTREIMNMSSIGLARQALQDKGVDV